VLALLGAMVLMKNSQQTPLLQTQAVLQSMSQLSAAVQSMVHPVLQVRSH
jgi:hypothetical protein